MHNEALRGLSGAVVMKAGMYRRGRGFDSRWIDWPRRILCVDKIKSRPREILAFARLLFEN